MDEKRTVTLEVPEGMSEEEVLRLVELTKKELVRGKPVPYIGYGCGKMWICSGVRYEDAKAHAIDSFKREFEEVLPPNIDKKEIDWAVGVRKLGDEYLIPIADAIEAVRALHFSKPRKKPRNIE